jgi:CheY-like chemotaxis protein
MARKVLVVDDSSTIRKMISKWLVEENMEALEAENGKQAVEMLTSQKIDIVLLDLVMPEMDGFDVIEALTQKSINTNIFVLSGRLQKDKVSRLMQAGVTVIISKPVKKDRLMQEIEHMSADKGFLDAAGAMLEKSHQVTQGLKGIIFQFAKFFNLGKKVLADNDEREKRKYIQSLEKQVLVGGRLAEKSYKMVAEVEKTLDNVDEMVAATGLLDDKFMAARSGLKGASAISEEATLEIGDISEKLQSNIGELRTKLGKTVETLTLADEAQSSFDEIFKHLESIEDASFNIGIALQFQDILSQKLSAVASIQTRIRERLANTMHHLKGTEINLEETEALRITDASILEDGADQSAVDAIITGEQDE